MYNFLNFLYIFIELIKNIQNEMMEYKKEFKEKLPKIYSKELLESLFYKYILKFLILKKYVM